MKRTALLLFVALTSAGLGFLWSFGSGKSTVMTVNQRFCDFRLETARLAEAAMPVGDEAHPLIRERLRATFSARFCKRVQMKAQDWRPYSKWLDRDNQNHLIRLTEEGSGPLGCQFAPACQSSIDSYWQTVFPSSQVKKLPGALSVADSELASWQETVKTLNDLLPQVEEQLRKDRDMLCLQAEDLRRSERLADFVAKKRAGSKRPQETDKVVRLRENQRSHLLQNIERFKVKWSQEQLANLDCLKDVNHGPTGQAAAGPAPVSAPGQKAGSTSNSIDRPTDAIARNQEARTADRLPQHVGGATDRPRKIDPQNN